MTTAVVVRTTNSIQVQSWASNGSQKTKNAYDFGVLFEITECFLEIGVQFLLADSANDAGACAISAVTRATIGDQKQNAIGIAMD